MSPSFVPPLLKGLKVDLEQPFKFDFILSAGSGEEAKDPAFLREEAAKLVRYFLASFTIPENDLWVNLSPYEKDRIIPDAFGITEMGRDLLAQDYFLKQITASLIYPEDGVGQAFWAEVYQRAHEQYGTTDIPTDVFNKVWIVPHEARVYQKDDKAVVVKATLKVMLETDYLASEKAEGSLPLVGKADITKQILREIVIPVLEKEVNEGRNFAALRQVYHSLILAKWYKQTIKQSVLSQAYGDLRKVKGIEIDDQQAREKIYAQYLQAFKKGAFDYIKEEHDPFTQEVIPRKYFSGGVGLLKLKYEVTQDDAEIVEDGFSVQEVTGRFDASGMDEKTADDVMQEIEAADGPLWRFIKDDPEAVGKIRGRVEDILKGRFLDEISAYLQKLDRKGKVSLAPGDAQDATVILFGSAVWGRNPGDRDIFVVINGEGLVSLKKEGIDANVVGRKLLDQGLSRGASGAVLIQRAVESNGIFLRARASDLALPLLGFEQKLREARRLTAVGREELNYVVFGMGEIGSLDRAVLRLVEAYALVHDVLMARGEPELKVGEKDLGSFYRGFLKAEKAADYTKNMIDPEMELDDAFRDLSRLIDRLDDAEHMSKALSLDVAKIIENIHAFGSGLTHSQTGRKYSLVAVPETLAVQGTAGIKIFLKDAKGVVSKDPLVSLEVLADKGLVVEKDGQEEAFGMDGGGLGKAWHRVLSRSIPDGTVLQASIFHKDTRMWLTHGLSIVDARVFTDIDGQPFEVVDDRFDRHGRLDRRSLYRYQILLSDALVQSSMGAVWSRQSGFRDIQLFVQDEKTRLKGLEALKWWINETKKPEGAPDQIHVEPFFEARNVARLVEDDVLNLRASVQRYQSFMVPQGSDRGPSLDELVEWFMPYIDLPQDILAEMVRGSFMTRSAANPSNTFGLGGAPGQETTGEMPSELDVMRQGVDQLVQAGVGRMVVTTYGAGEFVPKGAVWNGGDTEFESTLKAVIEADARYGQITDVTFVIYDHSPAFLAKYPRQLYDLEQVFRKKYPGWKGRMDHRVHYLDLFKVIDDERVVAAVATPSHITFWRHTWIGDSRDPFPEREADRLELEQFASRLEKVIERGVILVRESYGDDFLTVRKVIGFDPGEKTSDPPEIKEDGAFVRPAGGIDLKADRIDLQTTGSGVKLGSSGITDAAPFDHIQGLVPVIISITPVSGLREFAGLIHTSS